MRCPCCGKGRLFGGYLGLRAACPDCGESFAGIHADDGPAWLTLLITLHIMVPVMLISQTGDLISSWPKLLVILLAACVIMFLLLPPVKGFFVAMIWLTRRRKTKA